MGGTPARGDRRADQGGVRAFPRRMGGGVRKFRRGDNLPVTAMQKPIGAPVTLFVFSFATALSGILYHYRLLPSLRSDTLPGSSPPYPTERLVHIMSPVCFLFAFIYLVVAVVGLLTLNEARRRYIAALPRWLQWFIWPFHGTVAPTVSTTRHAPDRAPANESWRSAIPPSGALREWVSCSHGAASPCLDGANTATQRRGYSRSSKLAQASGAPDAASSEWQLRLTSEFPSGAWERRGD